MPYLVFARKYRPNNFDEVVGQEHITTTFKNAIKSDRLAHAYIFAGPRGIGKTSCARILAKSLNCQNGPMINPCNKCDSCLEINESRSMDVIEIDGASNRGIDEIRALRDNVKFAPTKGKYKIYIIDEVHMLTSEAFNALLKTLEEPPEHVKFIFATTLPHKILPTILSRCQRFDFRHIPVLKIIAKLEEIAKAEKIAVDKEVLFLIAKAASGSLRDAESILDQLSSFTNGRIEVETIYSMLGMVHEDFIFEMTQAIAGKDAISAIKMVDRFIGEGKDINQFIDSFVEHFRNLMVARIGGKLLEGLLDLPDEVKEKVLKQSQSFSLREILSAIELLISAREMGRVMDSLRIPVEMVIAKLTYKSEANNPIAKSVEVKIAAEQPIKNNPAVPPPVEHGIIINQAEDKDASLVTLEKISGIWSEFIHRTGKIKMSVATYLSEAVPIKFDNNILLIGLPKDAKFHKEALERKENLAVVEGTFKQILNAGIKVGFKVTDDKKVNEHEPFIKSALDAFKGKVINQWHNHHD
ncbi:MAG: DNA polymerase III subunit gamma/tau [Candidatus Omnitrophota bacterium]|nr:DNA polymerase III subunit gamma/tau [Candidatus Omnitrophota bacterium]